LTPWDDPSEEALDTLLLINMFGALRSGPAEVSRPCLCLIFKDFEWPHKPEREHRGQAAAEELPNLIVENVGMTADAIQD
jgi:hypothetical protein